MTQNYKKPSCMRPKAFARLGECSEVHWGATHVGDIRVGILCPSYHFTVDTDMISQLWAFQWEDAS